MQIPARQYKRDNHRFLPTFRTQVDNLIKFNGPRGNCRLTGFMSKLACGLTVITYDEETQKQEGKGKPDESLGRKATGLTRRPLLIEVGSAKGKIAGPLLSEDVTFDLWRIVQMKKLAALAGIAAFGLAGQVSAYDATGTITFSWATGGAEKVFTASGGGATLTSVDNTNSFFAESGNNGNSYYNADFATSEWHTSVGCVDQTGGPGDFRAQYACKITANDVLFPVADEGPGGMATGNITVTDTTLTGTLTVANTNDEGAGPQPGTTEATGFNIRSADGSPFKNVWYGVSNSATLSLNLTGTFNETNWEITGGTVVWNDPNFQCGVADFGGVLCSASQLGDGQASFLSWGDDSNTAPGTVGDILVYDPDGTTLLSTISGVLASLTLDEFGNITTTAGEYRRANEQGACPGQSLRWDSATNQVTCGNLNSGNLIISGVVPVPAAVWLFGSALGLLGWIRRRA